VLDGEGDRPGLARAWRLIGWVHATAGRYGAAEEAVLRSIEQAQAVGDRRQESRALPIYAACALYGPLPVREAISRCERLLGQAHGDQRGNALIRLYLSQLHAMIEEFDRARDLYRQSRAAFEDLGERLLAAFTASNSGRVEMMAGHPEAAERELRRDYAALDRMGEKFYLSTIAALLAHALFLLGKYEEADAFSRVSEETSEDDVESQSLWRRARAKVLAQRGRLEEAEALAREASRMIAQTDSPVLHANTLLDLADVLTLAGRRPEATPLVEEALRLFEQKGSVVGAARARSGL
jgi:tetratricopeptide (TPR) repeat protein